MYARSGKRKWHAKGFVEDKQIVQRKFALKGFLFQVQVPAGHAMISWLITLEILEPPVSSSILVSPRT
jgi:hypothetical protein